MVLEQSGRAYVVEALVFIRLAGSTELTPISRHGAESEAAGPEGEEDARDPQTADAAPGTLEDGEANQKGNRFPTEKVCSQSVEGLSLERLVACSIILVKDLSAGQSDSKVVVSTLDRSKSFCTISSHTAPKSFPQRPLKLRSEPLIRQVKHLLSTFSCLNATKSLLLGKGHI